MSFFSHARSSRNVIAVQPLDGVKHGFAGFGNAGEHRSKGGAEFLHGCHGDDVFKDNVAVGFKLCLGDPSEFIAICKAMLETGESPDFITVDGGEGGTGAAPLEYSNHVGMPLRDGLAFVDNTLRGFGLRDQVRIIAAGKIITGFHMARALALGADLCNSARGMMLALGCVQSLECNSNHCPTGITTQDPSLVRGLVVPDKGARVARYHAETIHSLLDLTSSAGLASPCEIGRTHLYRRVDTATVRSFAELYPEPMPGSYLEANASQRIYPYLQAARSDSFHSAPPAS